MASDGYTGWNEVYWKVVGQCSIEASFWFWTSPPDTITHTLSLFSLTPFLYLYIHTHTQPLKAMGRESDSTKNKTQYQPALLLEPPSSPSFDSLSHDLDTFINEFNCTLFDTTLTTPSVSPFLRHCIASCLIGLIVCVRVCASIMDIPGTAFLLSHEHWVWTTAVISTRCRSFNSTTTC